MDRSGQERRKKRGGEEKEAKMRGKGRSREERRGK